MLGLMTMGLMEKPPLLLRTTQAQLLGTLNYSTSVNREGSHLNSRN
ncbi:unnamed protein product [Penicillium nalgiovense]|nr:unnamed protein product [Penicillium nalgiovense]